MIEILLATYNAGKYLAKQLNSILAQDHSDFIITICDGNSEDTTLSVIKEYASANPKKIQIYNAPSKSHSAKKMFSALIKQAKGDYIMFCDQDGIWEKNKISKMLAEMRTLEARKGKNTPILVHSDMSVINDEGKEISKSISSYAGFSAKSTNFKKLVVQNNVISGSIMFNSKLLPLVKKIPDRAVSHDWWVALVAACFGKTDYMNEKLCSCRALENNSIHFMKAGSNRSDLKLANNQSYWQAAAFLETYTSGLNEEKKQILLEYSALASASKSQKLQKVMFGGYGKSNVSNFFGQLMNL